MINAFSSKQFGKNKSLNSYGLKNPLEKTQKEINMEKKQIQTKQIQTKHNMHKVEDEIVKFEKPGQEIEGELISIQETSAFGNPVYKLENDGKSYAVFATAILQRHMASAKVGKWVRIVFIGTIPNSNPKLNPIKNFDVFVED